MVQPTSIGDKQLLEKVLYILNKTGGIDYYRLFKILYFAEREYLARYYRKMVEDSFCALPYGPVPTRLYDAIRNEGHAYALSQALWASVRSAGEDSPSVLLPMREADMDYIAKYEAEVLDEMIALYSPKTFSELKQLSHGEAWSKTGHCRAIAPEDIALEGGLALDELPYLKELVSWQIREYSSSCYTSSLWYR